MVTLLLEREPTITLEPRHDSPCPPLAHSSSHAQPPRTEVSIETTLSGRAKDYSFVTDGEKADTKCYIAVHHTHTLLHTEPRGDCESSDSYIVVPVRAIQH